MRKKNKRRAHNDKKNKFINTKKTMKKLLLTSAIILTATVFSFAQTGSGSAEVTLNVKLNPIQTIEINSATSNNIDLVYDSEADYADGVEVDIPDHLVVYSTGGFAVSVKSESDNIQRVAGAETIAASTIKVQASGGSTNPLSNANYNNVSLSTTEKDLISSSTGGANKTFNIKYAGIGNDGYLNKYFNNENPTVYTTKVTYSIVAQ